MHVEAKKRPQQGLLSKESQSFPGNTCPTQLIALKGSTSNHAPKFSFTLLFSTSSRRALWTSSSAVLHSRHTQPSSQSTSSSFDVPSTYCKKTYYVPPLIVQEFGQNSSSTPVTRSTAPRSRLPAINKKTIFCYPAPFKLIKSRCMRRLIP